MFLLPSCLPFYNVHCSEAGGLVYVGTISGCSGGVDFLIGSFSLGGWAGGMFFSPAQLRNVN